MELPKNIVQIGSPDKHYKIFVEDYVISYIKQINRNLNGGQTGIALYGKKYAEEEVRYYFLYGAAEIPGIENRGQYLSELEKEQIESRKQEFFEEWDFLAWCTLCGEMPDGFWLLEQGKGTMINGYATFFEKNDHMLNFMVIIGNRENRRTGEIGKEPATGESKVDYEWGRLAEGGNIDHRLSERSRKLEDIKKSRGGNYRNLRRWKQAPDKYEKSGGFKTLLTGVAVMLCVIGIATLSDEEKMKNLQVTARQILESISEQKLPEDSQVIPQVGIETGEAQGPAYGSEQVSTVESEAEQAPTGEQASEAAQTSVTEQIPTAEQLPEAEQPPVIEQPPVAEQPPVTEPQAEETPQEVIQPEVVPEVKTVTYVVEKGDMLLTICRRRYGSTERVKEICELNGITDPDDIKVGQIILLPE